MVDSWTKATALATVGAAALVAVQLGREFWREIVRRRTANARMATIAYQLRRQLRSWVGNPEHSKDFEAWIRNAQNDRSIAQHLDRAEQRLDDLMARFYGRWQPLRPKNAMGLVAIRVWCFTPTARFYRQDFRTVGCRTVPGVPAQSSATLRGALVFAGGPPLRAAIGLRIASLELEVSVAERSRA